MERSIQRLRRGHKGREVFWLTDFSVLFLWGLHSPINRRWNSLCIRHGSNLQPCDPKSSAKPEESEIGEETVAVEETVVAIETATTEAAIVIMPKSEVVAAAPGGRTAWGRTRKSSEQRKYLMVRE
jgi:hypothetical protein